MPISIFTVIEFKKSNYTVVKIINTPLITDNIKRLYKNAMPTSVFKSCVFVHSQNIKKGLTI